MTFPNVYGKVYVMTKTPDPIRQTLIDFGILPADIDHVLQILADAGITSTEIRIPASKPYVAIGTLGQTDAYVYISFVDIRKDLPKPKVTVPHPEDYCWRIPLSTWGEKKTPVRNADDRPVCQCGLIVTLTGTCMDGRCDGAAA